MPKPQILAQTAKWWPLFALMHAVQLHALLLLLVEAVKFSLFTVLLL